MNVIIDSSEVSMTLITNCVYLLNEPIVVNIVVEDVVILPIILRVLSLAVCGHIIVSEEKVQRLNSGKVGFCYFLISPKGCLFSLDLNLFEFHQFWLPQEVLGLMPCAVNDHNMLDSIKLILWHLIETFRIICRKQKDNRVERLSFL